MHNVEIMPDSSEIVRYDEPEIPLYIRHGVLSEYPDFRANCHWHEDLEWIHVLEGTMDYSIDGKRVTLETGNCLFVNAKHMHYGYSPERKECIFTCVLIHPSLLTANRRLYQELLQPFLENQAAPYLLFSRDDSAYPRIAGRLREVWQLKEHSPKGYQIEAAAILSSLIVSCLNTVPEQTEEVMLGTDQKLAAQKMMVAFIARNFSSEITLEEIAASASVSRSTCCRLFKAYVQQSPLAYLNDYRLRVSQEFLKDMSKSVTEVATLSGFNHVSYYSKMFCRSFGCTPTEYRRKVTSAER